MENALTYKDFYHPEDPSMAEPPMLYPDVDKDEPDPEQKES